MSESQYWLIGVVISLVVFIRMCWDYRTGDVLVVEMVEIGVRRVGWFWFWVVVLWWFLILAVAYPAIGLVCLWYWVRSRVFKKRSE